MYDELQPIWKIFSELTSTRQVGYTVSPLAPADVRAYLEMTGVPQWSWTRYFEQIMVIDRIWMRLLEKRRTKE